MLKALLKRKLRLAPLGDPDDDAAGDGSPRHAAETWTAHEDPLTAAVFARLAYLDPNDAWELLRASSTVLHGRGLPEQPPNEAATWKFWPRFHGNRSESARYVEPDVVARWGPYVLVFEAKHQGVQVAEQWVAQIRAVREANPGRELWFVAVGGIDVGASEAIVAKATAMLAPTAPPILALRWGDLRDRARARVGAARPGTAACLRDIAAALEAWGYRPPVMFASLVGIATPLRIRSTPADLPRLRPVEPRRGNR